MNNENGFLSVNSFVFAAMINRVTALNRNIGYLAFPFYTVVRAACSVGIQWRRALCCCYSRRFVVLHALIHAPALLS